MSTKTPSEGPQTPQNGPKATVSPQAAKETYDALAGFWERQGYMPSVRELAEILNLSVGTVQPRLQALVDRGAIVRHGPRAIVLKGLE